MLLRADAEQCWLHREVLPVLHEIETREQLPDELLEAALAYLDVTWSEAVSRARETDAAHANLHTAPDDDTSLSGAAHRYHAAVCVLRGLLAERVTPFVEAAPQAGKRPEPGAGILRITDTRRPPTGGRTPRAA